MRKIDKTQTTRHSGSSYPTPYDEPCKGRHMLALGKAAGLSQFGVNEVTLPPGSWTSQRHWHSHEDEFIYVLKGEVVLITDEGEALLSPGECAGFKAGVKNGHHLQNRSQKDAVILTIGTRDDRDQCNYPDIDMALPGAGQPYTHKDGTAYPPK